MRSEALSAETQPEATPLYVAPQLVDLGHWAAVTLAQSVPVTGFGLSNPFNSSQSSGIDLGDW